MPPHVATLLGAAAIAGLFWISRDRTRKKSAALWVPVLWFSIANSRPASLWLAAFGWIDAGWSIQSADQYLDGSPIDRNIFIALLAASFWVLLKRWNKTARLLKANAPIVIFFLYCAVSIAWSDYPDVAFKRWFKAVGNCAMVWIVLTEPELDTAVKLFVERVAFVMIPLSAVFIKYYPALGRGYNQWTWLPSYTGVTTNKNELGMSCLVLGLGSAWCLVSALRARNTAVRWRSLIAHCPILGLVCWLFYMADSMTSLSCFIIASSLMILVNLRAVVRRKWMIHCAVVILLGASASVLLLNTAGNVLSTIGRDPTLTGRTDLWNLVLANAGNSVVGTGFESYWLGARLQTLWRAVWWHPNEAHNGYLEIFINLGWVGIIVTAFVAITGYRNILTSLRDNRPGAALGLGYFIAALIYNVTEAAFKGVNPIWITFLLSVTAVPNGISARTHLIPTLRNRDWLQADRAYTGPAGQPKSA